VLNLYIEFNKKLIYRKHKDCASVALAQTWFLSGIIADYDTECQRSYVSVTVFGGQYASSYQRSVVTISRHFQNISEIV